MNKKIIVMIDNDPYFLAKWQETLGEEIHFIPFNTISDCEQALIDEPQKILKASCIIVDFEFGNTTAGKKDFASYLRNECGYKGAILMCSLHESFGEYDDLIQKSFTKIIDKTPLTWSELSKILEI